MKALSTINLLNEGNDGMTLKLSNIIFPSTLREISKMQERTFQMLCQLSEKIDITKELSFDEFYMPLHEFSAEFFTKEKTEILFEEISKYFMDSKKISLAQMYTYANCCNIDPNAKNTFTDLLKLSPKQIEEFYISMGNVETIVQAMSKKKVFQLYSALYSLMLKLMICNMLLIQLCGNCRRSITYHISHLSKTHYKHIKLIS